MHFINIADLVSKQHSQFLTAKEFYLTVLNDTILHTQNQ